MSILAIDTAGSACRVCVRTAAGDLERSEDIGRGHDQRLAVLVDAALREAGVEPRALSRIGVVTGPGSFTGVRVGVAFARGLALVTGAASVGVSALEAWARSVDPALERVAAIYDAKRGEVVWRAWSGGGPLKPERLDALSDARARLKACEPSGGWRYAGPGAGLFAPPSCGAGLAPPASVLLDLVERAQIGEAARPAYHRPPDAKLPGGVEV